MITYNVSISACEKGHQWPQAFGLLAQISSQRGAPKVMTYTASISACEKGRQWPEAWRLPAIQVVSAFGSVAYSMHLRRLGS